MVQSNGYNRFHAMVTRGRKNPDREAENIFRNGIKPFVTLIVIDLSLWLFFPTLSDIGKLSAEGKTMKKLILGLCAVGAIALTGCASNEPVEVIDYTPYHKVQGELPDCFFKFKAGVTTLDNARTCLGNRVSMAPKRQGFINYTWKESGRGGRYAVDLVFKDNIYQYTGSIEQ